MITEVISRYHLLSKKDPHHRFKSWEHCYKFFSENYSKLHKPEVFDHACLHLAFYLASWGMLRGSSFLLQKDYTVHTYFIKKVVMNQTYFNYSEKEQDTLIESKDIKNINKLIMDTKKAYQDNIKQVNGEDTNIHVTDTLASKILLGVYGIAPAYDRYFKEGLTLFGIKGQFDEQSIRELADFYNEYSQEFEHSRKMFNNDGVNYTPMKLIDMYFWQIGFMMDNLKHYIDEIKIITEFAEQYQSRKKEEKFEHNVQQNNFLRPAINPGLTEEIRMYIRSILYKSKVEGKEFVDIKSGDIHKAMGLQSRLPAVCNAMESLGVFRYSVLHKTASGKSSTNLIRYYLKDN